MRNFHRSAARTRSMLSAASVALFLLIHPGTTSANAEDDFLAAREAYRTGNFTRLTQYAKRLEGHVLAPYVEFYVLSMRLREATPEEIRSFLRRNADNPLGEKLRSDWLKLLARQQNWDLFTAEYPAVAAPDSELLCLAAQGQLARGDEAQLSQVKRLWLSTAELPGTCTALFDSLQANGRLTEQDVWTRLRLALEAGSISVARGVLPYLPRAQAAVLARMDKAADDPGRFLDKLMPDLQMRAGRELAMFALYRLARTQPQLAESYWMQVRPGFDEAEQQYLWGQLAFQAARRLEPFALDWYRRAGNGPLSDLQLSWRVRAALRVQDWAQVLAAIDAMSEAEQQRGAWRYWKARALKAQGKGVQANAILAPLSREFNYYGQLAMEELGASLGNAPGTYKATDEDVAKVRKVPAIQRALVLYQLELRTEANREWNYATRDFDDSRLLAAAELARRNQWYDRAINTADKTRDVHDFSLRYPTPHRELMQGYTRQWQLDEAWVYGLIRQESRFISVAKSNVGASGLMQIMPSTAKWVAKKLGATRFRQNLINRIDTNIEFGTYYLKHVLDDLGGQPVLATAAYNAGPNRARRWRDVRPMEGAIYAESIPFTETRDYVQKVMSNANYYAQRFDHQLRSLRARLGTISGTGGKFSVEDAPPEPPESE